MNSIKDVEKITGVSRRALQGYAEIGLLEPSAKTEGGYWLYDDEAIRKLVIIKVLANGDYTRKQMIDFFASSPKDILEECDELVQKLELEEKRIKGRKRAIRLFKVESQLSSSAREVLSGVNPSTTYQGKNFTDCMDDLIDRLSGLAGEVDAITLESYYLFWYCLVALGLLSNMKPSKKRLDEAVSETFYDFSLLMKHIDGFSGDFDLSNDDKEAIKLFHDFVWEYLQDDELATAINRACGEGASVRILKIIMSWKASSNTVEEA